MMRDRFLDDAARIIESAIQREDTTHAVFHGCYDWHSAVHGHFALLRLDRVRRTHEAQAREAAQRLASRALRTEHALLQAEPAFEMPYGRAWFLRLAIEHELWAAARDEGRATPLRPMADDVAASLCAWIEGRAFDPTAIEYQNHGWAAAQLFAWYAQRGDANGMHAVRAWVGAWTPTPEAGLSFARDAGRPEFFSLYGCWAHAVLETQTPEAARTLLAAAPIDAAALAPVDIPRDAVHALGMNWSRAWALARLADREPDPARARQLGAAFERHVEAGVRTHAVHAGRYHAYDHWVPQFAVYALTGDRS